MADIFLSKYENHDVVSAYIDDKLEYLSVVHPSMVGNVYICRVENIIKNLGSAFVRFGDNITGYVSFKSVLLSGVIGRTVKSPKEIRQGDSLLLQVDADEMKLKKARLSFNISVSGSYSVITLGRKGEGVSLKLPEEDRRSLSEELKDSYGCLCDKYSGELLGNTFGVIIRTEAINLSEDDRLEAISKDMEDSLLRLIDILNEAKTRTVFSCLYKNDSDDISHHIKNAENFLISRGITEHQLKTESVIYNTKGEIDKLKKNRVWLKSGAFLIIEQLESFNAIDVNTGKAIAGKNDIIAKVNKEAAREIFRQIRLRNLSGMILIDFINMKNKADVEDLCEYVKVLARKEPVHTEFIDITGLGIVELTRSKNEKSLKEILENHSEAVDNS